MTISNSSHESWLGGWASFVHVILNVPKCFLDLLNFTVSLICYFWLVCRALIRLWTMRGNPTWQDGIHVVMSWLRRFVLCNCAFCLDCSTVCFVFFFIFFFGVFYASVCHFFSVLIFCMGLVAWNKTMDGWIILTTVARSVPGAMPSWRFWHFDTVYIFLDNLGAGCVNS